MSCVVFDGSKTVENEDEVKSISPTHRSGGRKYPSFGSLKIKSGSVVEPSESSKKHGGGSMRSKRLSSSGHSTTLNGSFANRAQSKTHIDKHSETYKEFKNGIRVLKGGNDSPSVNTENQPAFCQQQQKNDASDENAAEILRLQQKMAKLQNKVASMQKRVLYLQENM